MYCKQKGLLKGCTVLFYPEQTYAPQLLYYPSLSPAQYILGRVQEVAQRGEVGGLSMYIMII